MVPLYWSMKLRQTLFVVELTFEEGLTSYILEGHALNIINPIQLFIALLYFHIG